MLIQFLSLLISFIAGTSILNRLMGKDCIKDMPDGIGATVARAIIQVPGASKMAKSTICAYGKSVDYKY